MRAVVFHRAEGVDGLRVEEFPEPVAKAGDVIVEVAATSINGFDPMIVSGSTGLRTPFPMIPCGDYAGRIVEFGPDTNAGDFSVGDRVCPHPFVFGEGMTGETRLGAACERVRIPLANLIPIPDAVSDVEAASLPIAYGTAQRLVHTRGRIQKGERVLVLGATGGVGTACVQLVRNLGGKVIATGSAAWKLEKLREIGAEHTIDTSRHAFEKWVAEQFGKPRMFGGGGVDVVINYVGGDTWARSLRCLAPHGRMITCGASAGYAPPTDIRYIWTMEQTILGSNGWSADDQIAVLAQVASGELKPVIHAVRPLTETADAIRDLAERRVVGKIVITP
jgi:alcohol dehydrogenase